MRIINYIAEQVNSIVQTHGTRDVVELCEALDIVLCYSPMGSAESGCKGFFAIFYGENCITINNRLPEQVARVVTAHELGHAVLHQNYAEGDTLSDFLLFDPGSGLEREANIFAAGLLISDEDLMPLIEDGYSYFDIAGMLNVPQELLSYRFELLRESGYHGAIPPVPAKSNFMKRAF